MTMANVINGEPYKNFCSNELGLCNLAVHCGYDMDTGVYILEVPGDRILESYATRQELLVGLRTMRLKGYEVPEYVFANVMNHAG